MEMVWRKTIQLFATSRTPKEEEKRVSSIHCIVQKDKAGEHSVTETQKGKKVFLKSKLLIQNDPDKWLTKRRRKYPVSW